jgi:hypothetical protein
MSGDRQRESLWRILTRNSGPSWREYWNVWWTLTVLAMVFTMIVVVLEVLGVFRDFGLVLTAFGLLVSILSGLTASTQTSVRQIGADTPALRDEVHTIGLVLERMERNLGAGLARIEQVLIERLPGPS